jgi:hypothetical protein
MKGTKVTISNGLYDRLKFVAQILLPALGALYFALAQIWHLPKAEEVVGTITVIDTFLGVILGLSANTYVKSGADVDGAINVVDTPEKTNFTLAIDTAPEKLAQQDRVVLKVTNVQPVQAPRLGADSGPLD